jgi:hypothetical protein
MLPFFARRSGLREGGSLSKYEGRSGMIHEALRGR